MFSVYPLATCAVPEGLSLLNFVAWFGMFQHVPAHSGMWQVNGTSQGPCALWHTEVAHGVQQRGFGKQKVSWPSGAPKKCSRILSTSMISSGVYPFSGSNLVDESSAAGMLVRRTQSPWLKRCSKRRSKPASIANTQSSRTDRTQSVSSNKH